MDEDVDVRVRRYKDVDLSGATVVEAIPDHGLVSAIAGSYLVRELGMDHVAGFECDGFPPVAMVWRGKPRSPLRVYARPTASGRAPFAVILGEFTPGPRLYRPISRAVLAWAESEGATRLVCPDGAPPFDQGYDPGAPRAAGVGSTRAARESIEKGGLQLLERGMISGVSAMLLTDALDRFDVLHVVVEAHPDPEQHAHDARAAAVALESLARLDPDLGVPLDALIDEAERAEALLRDLRERAKQHATEDDVASAYR